MGKLLLVLFLIIFSKTTYANTEMYAVEKDDGSVALVKYYPGSRDSLQEVLSEFGFVDKPIKKISVSELPDLNDRLYWVFDNTDPDKKIKIDLAKKQADLDKKAQEELEKNAVLEKLKITKEEFEKISKD